MPSFDCSNAAVVGGFIHSEPVLARNVERLLSHLRFLRIYCRTSMLRVVSILSRAIAQ